jgi:hypothetical protein
MLPVSLDCPFLIDPLLFHLVYSMLPVSLDCPFLIDPLLFHQMFRAIKKKKGIVGIVSSGRHIVL